MRDDSRVYRSRAAIMPAVTRNATMMPMTIPAPRPGGAPDALGVVISIQMQPATTAICSTMNASVFTMRRSIAHA